MFTNWACLLVLRITRRPRHPLCITVQEHHPLSTRQWILPQPLLAIQVAQQALGLRVVPPHIKHLPSSLLRLQDHPQNRALRLAIIRITHPTQARAPRFQALEHNLLQFILQVRPPVKLLQAPSLYPHRSFPQAPVHRPFHHFLPLLRTALRQPSTRHLTRVQLSLHRFIQLALCLRRPLIRAQSPPQPMEAVQMPRLQHSLHRHKILL